MPAEGLLVEAPVDPMSLLIGASAFNLRQAKKEVVRKLSRFCKQFVKKRVVQETDARVLTRGQDRLVRIKTGNEILAQNKILTNI